MTGNLIVAMVNVEREKETVMTTMIVFLGTNAKLTGCGIGLEQKIFALKVIKLISSKFDILSYILTVNSDCKLVNYD